MHKYLKMVRETALSHIWMLRTGSNGQQYKMVYLKGLFVRMAVVVAMLVICMEQCGMQAEGTRIAYKKPIYGKTNVIKEKRYRRKMEVFKATTIATSTTLQPTTSLTPTTTKLNTIPASPIPAAISDEITAEQQQVEVIVTRTNATDVGAEVENITTTAENITAETVVEEEDINKINLLQSDSIKEQSQTADELQLNKITTVLVAPTAGTATPKTVLTTTTTTATAVTESSLPVPCTCGIFLTSQIKRGSNEPPEGKPVILNELDRHFPCTAIGQKQCQTKCLETIVQHLPNSANILCATLNRDCRKERAYLFIKNCRNQWWNTNLAAGREYCCNNGKPYNCPLV